MHEVIILIQAIQFSISLNTSLKVSLNIQIFRVFEHVKVLEVLLNIHSVIWYFSYIYRIFYYNIISILVIFAVNDDVDQNGSTFSHSVGLPVSVLSIMLC